jgi:hypothetical protein
METFKENIIMHVLDYYFGFELFETCLREAQSFRHKIHNFCT